MEIKKLGWIGLGNMGTPMAKNLEKAGFELSVYNRSLKKTFDFKDGNIIICNSVSELVKSSDIIFTMVSDDIAAKSIYEQILSTAEISGKLFIDMSTISQKLSVWIAGELKNKGAKMLDAPVAGSTLPATNGTLVIMVGGEEADLELASPYLQKLGKDIRYLGANGKGIAAKLSINYFLSILYLGLAEAVLLGEKNGVDRADLLDIINSSAAGSGATKVKTPLLIDGNYPAAFSLNLMLKDVLLAKNNGADFPLTEAVANAFTQAKDAGYGANDVMAIIDYLKEPS